MNPDLRIVGGKDAAPAKTLPASDLLLDLATSLRIAAHRMSATAAFLEQEACRQMGMPSLPEFYNGTTDSRPSRLAAELDPKDGA